MLSRYLRLLRANRNYRLLWLAQLVSELGDWFYTLSVYSLILELTGGKAEAVGLHLPEWKPVWDRLPEEAQIPG